MKRALVTVALLLGVALLAEGMARVALWAWFGVARAHDGLWCATDEQLARVAFAWGPERADSNFVPDPELGYRPAPDLRRLDAQGLPVLTTNARGVRGLTDVPLERTPGRPRVVAVGDSFTFGADVGDAQAWPAVLAADLGIEVVNLGVQGFGLDQVALRLEREAFAYHPDVVLIGYYVSSAGPERLLHAWSCGPKPRFERTGGELALVGTPVPGPDQVRAEVRRAPALGWLLRLAWRALSPAPADDAVARRELVHALLDRMVAAVRQAGARPVVVFLPSANQPTAADYRLDRDGLLGPWCARSGVPCVDAGPALVPGPEGPGWREAAAANYLGTNPHYSPLGHARVAQAVAAALRPMLAPIPVPSTPQEERP